MDIGFSERVSHRPGDTPVSNQFFSGRGTKSARSPAENLTDREFEVFRYIGEGLSTKKIAEKMHVSPKTVEVHRMNVKAKLKLQTAAELIRYAVRWDAEN